MSNDKNKAKAEKKSVMDLKNLCLLLENSVEGLGDSTVGVIYLSMRIYARSCCIFPLKKLPQLHLVVQVRAQLEHNSHKVMVGVEPTS